MKYPGGDRTFRLSALLGALLVAVLLSVSELLAQGAVSHGGVPQLNQRVTDLSATLTAQQAGQLEAKLAQLEAQKGSQIAVLLVRTTAGETIESYSLRVVEQNKIGRKGIDDGVLLLVATEDRAVRIEVGYGLEGALSDAKSAQIIRQIIIPRFREGRAFEAIQGGVEAIAAVVAGEPLPLPRGSAANFEDQPGLSGLIVPLFFFLLVASQPVRALFGRLPGGLITFVALSFLGVILGSVLVGALLGLFAGLFVAFGSALPVGYSGRRYGSSGWGGGFGGGSIGWGGGGGSFGGGGASGRW